MIKLRTTSLFWSFCTLLCFCAAPLKAAQIPTNSSVLFVGSESAVYQAKFEEIYNADNTVTPLNLSFASQNLYWSASVYEEFFDLQNKTNYNSTSLLMDTLDNNYDYVVVIPSKHTMEDTPGISMEGLKSISLYLRLKGLDSKLIYPMIWDNSAGGASIEYYEEVTYRIADAVGAEAIPTGLAWNTCQQDSSLKFSASDPFDPSDDAAYVFALTLYSHFFEKDASSSNYDHGGNPFEDEATVVAYAYTNWNSAKSATHYTGDFIGSNTRIFNVPHVFDGTAWASMGRSSEKRTGSALANILKGISGETQSGLTHINGYHYDANGYDFRYFPRNLDVTEIDADATNIVDKTPREFVAAEDYSFAFGRYYTGDLSAAMDQFHLYDPNADARFIAFHWIDSGNTDPINSAGYGYLDGLLLNGQDDEDAYVIPQYPGFTRKWLQQPGIITSGSGHLSPEGYSINAAMMYAVATGNNPGRHPSDWDWNLRYLLNLSYKIVMEFEGLRSVELTPISDSQTLSTETTTPLQIDFRGLDFDSLPLSLNILSGPTGGTLSGSGFARTYTPNSDFEGTDTITYTVDNGTRTSEVGVVTINVYEPVQENLIWERGRVTGVDGNWKIIDLRNDYTDMVVIASPIYDENSPPIVTRIRNASGNSFELLAQRADGLTDAISPIEVEYFVTNKGRYTLEDHGILMEARKYLSTTTDHRGNNWAGTLPTYKNSYNNPVVIGQVMSYNDPDFSYFWSSSVDKARQPPNAAGLRVGKAVGLDTDQTRDDETVGYIVIESASGTLPGGIHYRATMGGTSVSSILDTPPDTYTFDPFTDPGGAIVSASALRDTDGVWAVLYPDSSNGGDFLTTNSIHLAFDKDNISGSSRSSTSIDQRVSYLVFSAYNYVDPIQYLPGAADEDTDSNGLADIIQFSAGGDFNGSSMDSVFSFSPGISNGNFTVNIDVYRRQGLDAYNLSQKVMIAFDLEGTWYNVDSSAFSTAYPDVTVTPVVQETNPAAGSPAGDVDLWRYTFEIPNSYRNAFMTLRVE